MQKTNTSGREEKSMNAVADANTIASECELSENEWVSSKVQEEDAK